jgi:hypothetical protein
MMESERGSNERTCKAVGHGVLDPMHVLGSWPHRRYNVGEDNDEQINLLQRKMDGE